MLPQTFTKDTSLRIGVLLAPPPVQLLDLACIDIFYSMSHEYIGGLELLPQAIKHLAIHKIEIFYLADKEAQNISKIPSTSSTGTPPKQDNDFLLTTLTADISIRITSDLSDAAVQPGSLTILLIPGPDPRNTPSARDKSFIQSHATCGTTDIITICTGIYPACYSGICDGKTVTGPRGLLPELSKKFSTVGKFEDVRWTRDLLGPTNNKSTSSSTGNGKTKMRPAELWTSAGITNGHDATSAYIREHFDRDLGEVVLRMADVGDRPREYDVGRVADGAWWVTTILRAVVKGFWR